MEIKRSGSKPSDFDLTRRELLKLTAATGGALAAGRLLPGAAPPAAAQGANAAPPPVNVVLRVNGAEHRLTLDPRTTLLDARRSHYLKVRDRASFEFAVVSAAVALEMDGARIRQARIALGGVGTKPWRIPQVEAALAGASLDPAALRSAAALAAQGAQGRGHNDFKIELMQRAIVRAVETAGGHA
jgi:CO dehydrogenase flavoprotein C-terminal domain